MEEGAEFRLPHGYRDGRGVVHRQGAMRLATALDEIAARRRARERADPAEASLLLLSRTVIRLGELGPDEISPEVIRSMPTVDLAHLREVYRRLNRIPARGSGACPLCGAEYEAEGSGGRGG